MIRRKGHDRFGTGGERRLIVLVLVAVSLVTRWVLRGSAGLLVLQSEVSPPPEPGPPTLG